MTHEQLLALGDAAGGDARCGIFLEGLAKGAALAAVEVQHRGIGRDAGECLVDHGARDAVGGGLARHRRDEGVEVAAALGRPRGQREQQRDDGGGEQAKKKFPSGHA